MSALALALAGSRPFRSQQLIHPLALDPSRGQRIGRPADGGAHAARPPASAVELSLSWSLWRALETFRRLTSGTDCQGPPFIQVAVAAFHFLTASPRKLGQAVTVPRFNRRDARLH